MRAAPVFRKLVLVGLFLAGPIVFGAEYVGWWQRLTLAIAGAWAAAVAVRLHRLLRSPGEAKDIVSTMVTTVR